MNEEKVPTKEPAQKVISQTISAAELSKAQIQARLEALEEGQKQIIKMLAEQILRIDQCSISR